MSDRSPTRDDPRSPLFPGSSLGCATGCAAPGTGGRRPAAATARRGPRSPNGDRSDPAQPLAGTIVRDTRRACGREAVSTDRRCDWRTAQTGNDGRRVGPCALFDGVETKGAANGSVHVRRAGGRPNITAPATATMAMPMTTVATHDAAWRSPWVTLRRLAAFIQRATGSARSARERAPSSSSWSMRGAGSTLRVETKGPRGVQASGGASPGCPSALSRGGGGLDRGADFRRSIKSSSSRTSRSSSAVPSAWLVAAGSATSDRACETRLSRVLSDIASPRGPTVRGPKRAERRPCRRRRPYSSAAEPRRTATARSK